MVISTGFQTSNNIKVEYNNETGMWDAVGSIEVSILKDGDWTTESTKTDTFSDKSLEAAFNNMSTTLQDIYETSKLLNEFTDGLEGKPEEESTALPAPLT